MSARMVFAVVLAVAAQPVFADRAVSRGGSSASSKASSHPSPSASSHSASSSHSAKSSGHAVGAPSGANDRHPRPGTGSGSRHGYGRGYGYRYYPPAWSWGWGSYPYYGWGYYPYYWGSGWGWSGGGTFYHVRRSNRYEGYGSLRVLVDPDDARVFLDGRYVGEVDDFDGMFNHLRASEGRHELTLKKEGYRTHRILVFVPEGETIKIHFHMSKGTGEDPVEDLAGEENEPPRRRADVDAEQQTDESKDLEEEASEAEEDAAEDVPRPARPGELVLSVRPDDASVYLDGRFRGLGKDVSKIELPPGRHRVEVVRPGFPTLEREVEVVKDQTTRLVLELERP